MRFFRNDQSSIAQLGASIRNGELTCVDLLSGCLDRIEQRESELHAWVVVDRDRAMNIASTLDQNLAAGHDKGPLHGIPIGIKDIIDVEGLPTAAGFEPWRNRIANTDAPLVAKLREAGAVIVGKTVTTQFACFDPPSTRNPWHHERTPGGSSSGSAVAVATGMCVAAIGTQTGGSIIRPASYCGVAGFKPTFGRISLQQVVPVAPSLDHAGPIARCVEDLRIMTAILDAETSADASHLTPRIAIPEDAVIDRCDKDTRHAFGVLCETLRTAGTQLTQIPIPENLDTILHYHGVIMAVEIARGNINRYKQHHTHFFPGISALIEEGVSIDPETYKAALEFQRYFSIAMNDVMQTFDALLMPATPEPPPDRSTTGDPAFNSPWSLAGVPDISIPFAVTDDGLPLAMQLIAARDKDSYLLSLGKHFEMILDGFAESQ